VNPVALRASLYMALAGLPVAIAFLTEIVNKMLDGKPPLLNGYVWSLLAANTLYQMLLVLRAYVDGSAERAKKPTTEPNQ
jgi:hypothetical protein